MYRKFGSLHHGRGNHELQRPTELYRLQCWKQALGRSSTGGYRATGEFVFTVCDNAASEVCPIWPGQPMTAHWGVADPAAVRGTAEEIKRAYRDAFVTLERRIGLFLCLPLATISKLAIKKEIDKIGHQ